MTKGKIDQRVVLTRSLLRSAMVQLMLEQHISKISVRSLCETAGINRSTFYAHYGDQYELLHYVEQDVLTNLKHNLESQDFSGNRPLSAQVLTRVLEYVKINADLFKALLSENCDFTFQRDVVQLAQIIASQANQSFDPKTQEYLQTFGITGCVSVLQKWLHDGMVESPAKMTEFILQVVYGGIASFE